MFYVYDKCNHLDYLDYSLLLVDSIMQLDKDTCTIACSPFISLRHTHTSAKFTVSNTYNHTFSVGILASSSSSEVNGGQKKKKVPHEQSTQQWLMYFLLWKLASFISYPWEENYL